MIAAAGEFYAMPSPAPSRFTLRSALRRFGRVPALIEWDDHIPELERVVEESRRAREVETEVLG